MTKLQRYTSFEKLKSTTDSKEKPSITDVAKSSELEDFIISLRNNLSALKKEKTAHEKHANR
ncbi:MAG TPA: hypothetical protein VGN20_00615 [Mucilaginibacter sp.]|jgi:hypothetical protein